MLNLWARYVKSTLNLWPGALNIRNTIIKNESVDTVVVAEKIKNIEAEGVSGDNSVKVILNGEGEMMKLEISPETMKEEKSIVTPIAGTTRDSIDSYLKYYNKTITLVDTAGLRKRSKIGDSIEFYSSVRTQRAILNCDVSLVLIDAEKEFLSLQTPCGLSLIHI